MHYFINDWASGKVVLLKYLSLNILQYLLVFQRYSLCANIVLDLKVKFSFPNKKRRNVCLQVQLKPAAAEQDGNKSMTPHWYLTCSVTRRRRRPCRSGRRNTWLSLTESAAAGRPCYGTLPLIGQCLRRTTARTRPSLPVVTRHGLFAAAAHWTERSHRSRRERSRSPQQSGFRGRAPAVCLKSLLLTEGQMSRCCRCVNKQREEGPNSGP